MTTFAYITYAQMEAQAVRHFQRYHDRTSFQTIARDLFARREYREGVPDLPRDITWSALSDEAFYDVMLRLPVRDIFRDAADTASPQAGADGIFPAQARRHRDADSILPGSAYAIAAEAIMPETLEVYAIRYIRDIVERMHTHNFFEVNYVFSGKCNMIFENETRELTAGELCIIAPHSRHDVTVTDESIVVSLMLRQSTFETTFFALLAQEDLLASFFRGILYSRTETANYMLFSTDNSPEIRASIKDIFMESHIRDSYSAGCIVSRVQLLFSLMLRRYADSIRFYENQKNTTEHTSVTRLLQYIQTHAGTVTLASLADTFGYNPSYLSRLIRNVTGRTLTQILTTYRLKTAVGLLVQTNLSIEAIARTVGYDSVDHFSRQFKRCCGMPPREYRRRQLPDG